MKTSLKLYDTKQQLTEMLQILFLWCCNVTPNDTRPKDIGSNDIRPNDYRSKDIRLNDFRPKEIWPWANVIKLFTAVSYGFS